jgi:uncharacterized protein YcgI (DUF1989 family)
VGEGVAMGESVFVKGGTGFARRVPQGTVVTIVDVAGKQVGDLVLFRADDPTERFSQANTRKLENTIYLGKGSTLWSTKCLPLSRIEGDTVKSHDILSSACSPHDYPIRFGIRSHPSCLANLREALASFGIAEHLIPDPMNVFMRQQLSREGTFIVVEPLSAAGDHTDLRILMDCILAISACPQDQNLCNGYSMTDLVLEFRLADVPT